MSFFGVLVIIWVLINVGKTVTGKDGFKDWR